MGGDSGPGGGSSGMAGRTGGGFAGGMPGFQGSGNRDGGGGSFRQLFGRKQGGAFGSREKFQAWVDAGRPGTLKDFDGSSQKKGSNRHISTAPTKNPFQHSLLGGTALANTATPSLLS